MKKVIIGLVVVAVLALIGAGVVWWLLRDQGEPERDRAGAPREPAVSMISSAGVEKNISRRLTAVSGRQVDVVCPPQVGELVGTTFTCEASFAGEEAVQTIANVEITGGGGEFSWTSEDAPRSEPAPSP